jgi:hypothetical protein
MGPDFLFAVARKPHGLSSLGMNPSSRLKRFGGQVGAACLSKPWRRQVNPTKPQGEDGFGLG